MLLAHEKQEPEKRGEGASLFPQHGPDVLIYFVSCCLLRQAFNFLRKTDVISFRVFSIDPSLFRPLYLKIHTEQPACCLDGDASVLTGPIGVSRTGLYKSGQSLSPSKSCLFLNVVLNYLEACGFLRKGTLCVLAGLQYN